MRSLCKMSIIIFNKELEILPKNKKILIYSILVFVEKNNLNLSDSNYY